MDEKVDTGNLLFQVPFEIAHEDNIGDVVKKLNQTGYSGTCSLFKELHRNPDYAGIEQDHSVANYWRMRTPHDVTLDPRMSVSAILRTVRSFCPPHLGCNLIFEGNTITVIDSVDVSSEFSDDKFRNLEPGRVLSAQGRVIRIKADDGVVDLVCNADLPAHLLRAQHIHPPSKYLEQWPDSLSR